MVLAAVLLGVAGLGTPEPQDPASDLVQPTVLRPVPAAAREPVPQARAVVPDTLVGAVGGTVGGTVGGEAPTPATAPAGPAADPVSLAVPALDLSVPLMQLGLQDDGTVEVPADADDAGWFRLGPPPGDPGSAVLLGHVDSRRGPGVFFRLHALQVGDSVEVGRADGSTARFAVTSVDTYPKDAFPGELVYGGQGASTLQLVTCGGDFDRTARSYLSNVVVSTSLVGVTPAPGVSP